MRSLWLALLLIAACSTGGSPPVVGKAPAAIASISPSPSPLVIPAPTTPFVRCATSALEMRLVTVGAATGNVGGLIEVRNATTKDCDLYGYAGVQLLDAYGRSLHTHVTWSRSSFFTNGDVPLEIVGLPAGTPPISPSRPVAGHAYIPLAWNDVQDPCILVSQLRVTPPDAHDSSDVSAIPPGGTPGQMSFCSDGAVTVNPIRVASY